MRAAAGALLLAVWTGAAVRTQWNQQRWTFAMIGKASFGALLRSAEEERLAFVRPDVAAMLQRLRALPPGSVALFLPPLDNSPPREDEYGWWWTQVMLRYFAYPRKVLAFHMSLFDGDTRVFLDRYLGGAPTVVDTRWARDRGITHLILYRSGRLGLVPATTPLAP